MSKPLILELKAYKENMSKIVMKSKERLPITPATSKKVTFENYSISGNTDKLSFNQEESAIIIGKGVSKVEIMAKAYVLLLKVGAYCEIKIIKNEESNVLGKGLSYGAEGNETSLIKAEAEIVDVKEGDKIYLEAYNSNSTVSIAIDPFVERTLSVKVLE